MDRQANIVRKGRGRVRGPVRFWNSDICFCNVSYGMSRIPTPRWSLAPLMYDVSTFTISNEQAWPSNYSRVQLFTILYKLRSGPNCRHSAHARTWANSNAPLWSLQASSFNNFESEVRENVWNSAYVNHVNKSILSSSKKAMQTSLQMNSVQLSNM